MQISAKQKQVIWGISKKVLNISDDELYLQLCVMFSVSRMSHLTEAQADLFIAELRRKKEGLGADRLTEKQYSEIKRRAKGFNWDKSALSAFCRRVTGIDDIHWLGIDQARCLIAGMEKLRRYNGRRENGVSASDKEGS